MSIDHHVHTHYSDDSTYPMEQVVRDAISMGMRELCFTDHVDHGVKWDVDDPRAFVLRKNCPDPLANVDLPAYVAEIGKLREKYADQIALRLGLEFGIQVHTIPKYEELFRKYPFDLIILSIHQVEDKEFWTQDYQRGRTQEAYDLGYYEEMLSVVRQYRNYSVLGHMDLISRYDQAGIFPFERIEEIVTEILKQVIADGKGIEVNTSCHRYGLKDLTPSRDILRLYRSLGGEILTLGSDSHKPEHLGAYIRETARELEQLGFRHYCTYSGMEPIFHALSEL